MLRNLLVCCALGSCVALVAACPKKKDDAADAGDEAGVVAVVAPVDAAPAAPAAKNAPDVARFPAEKALTDDDAKTLEAAQAKTACKAGGNVALLKVGTDPFKIAEFQDCLLVSFSDPKDATATLMGWIPKSAFAASVPRDAGVKDAAAGDAAVTNAAVIADAAVAVVTKCPAGQEMVVNVAGGGGVCRKKCSADKDCKTPTVDACAPATTLAGKIAKVCAGETP